MFLIPESIRWGSSFASTLAILQFLSLFFYFFFLCTPKKIRNCRIRVVPVADLSPTHPMSKMTTVSSKTFFFALVRDPSQTHYLYKMTTVSRNWLILLPSPIRPRPVPCLKWQQYQAKPSFSLLCGIHRRRTTSVKWRQYQEIGSIYSRPRSVLDPSRV